MINKYQYARMKSISYVIVLATIGVFFIGFGLSSHINVYVTPEHLLKNNSSLQGVYCRLGGNVMPGSITLTKEGVLHFIAQDTEKKGFNIKVEFKGVLPSLFKEGKAMLAQGVFKNNIFYAENILAKHDENYQPKIKNKVGIDGP